MDFVFIGFEIREVLDGFEVKRKQPQDEAAYDTVPRAVDYAVGSYKDMADNGMILPVEDGHGLQHTLPEPDRVRSKTVHFVLPLFNRLATFARFVDNYESVCLANDHERHVTLTVVPFGQATVDRAVAAVDALTARYPRARAVVLPDPGGPFARAVALHAGAENVLRLRDNGSPTADVDDDPLLFFVDVDMLWTNALVDRVRLNTIRGKSVYFPIVYSEFDPVVVYGRATSPNHFLVNQDTGYWRQYGFGIVGVYKSDLTAVGGLDTSIRGWGNEDVDLYEKFVRARPASVVAVATVFRAADPDLVHVYHPVECDPELPDPKARMCANTRFETYGNVDQFADIIYRNRDKLYGFAAEQLNKSAKATVEIAAAPAAVLPPIS